MKIQETYKQAKEYIRSIVFAAGLEIAAMYPTPNIKSSNLIPDQEIHPPNPEDPVYQRQQKMNEFHGLRELSLLLENQR